MRLVSREFKDTPVPGWLGRWEAWRLHRHCVAAVRHLGCPRARSPGDADGYRPVRPSICSRMMSVASMPGGFLQHAEDRPAKVVRLAGASHGRASASPIDEMMALLAAQAARYSDRSVAREMALSTCMDLLPLLAERPETISSNHSPRRR